MDFEVRRIRPGEGLRLRALRLHALADAPMAFGSTLAREEAFADRVWDERATGGAGGDERVTFIAERDGRWIGVATGLADDPDGPGPVLVGMFVDPAERGRGVGRALVEAVTAWARARGAGCLCLWVTSTNNPAIALYDRCGFRPTGDTQPLAHTPALTELRMVRDLRQGQGDRD
ncbi:MAG: GNAT family N-acetyltransferase [Candidatus Rokuibacteriota bacterium]|nr:MAG: GNAT family N-acetyltransferase [Candidatus Rokubacteria bacterium]